MGVSLEQYREQRKKRLRNALRNAEERYKIALDEVFSIQKGLPKPSKKATEHWTSVLAHYQTLVDGYDRDIRQMKKQLEELETKGGMRASTRERIRQGTFAEVERVSKRIDAAEERQYSLIDEVMHAEQMMKRHPRDKSYKELFDTKSDELEEANKELDEARAEMERMRAAFYASCGAETKRNNSKCKQWATVVSYSADSGKGKWIQGVVSKMKKGAFTKQALRADETPKEFEKEVLAHPEKFQLKTRRRAQLLKNMRGKD
jgi:hypothetical protein